MKASPELLSFGAALNQDFWRYGPRPEDWIKGALSMMSRERQLLLKRTIEQLLDAGTSGEKLYEMFKSTPADIHIQGDVRTFFQMIVDAIK